MTSPTLSLVVPVLDEEAGIPELGRRLHAFLEGLGEAWEVLFVDDGSMDRSPALLRELAAADSRSKVVKLSRTGSGSAVTARRGSSGRRPPPFVACCAP